MIPEVSTLFIVILTMLFALFLQVFKTRNPGSSNNCICKIMYIVTMFLRYFCHLLGPLVRTRNSGSSNNCLCKIMSIFDSHFQTYFDQLSVNIMSVFDENKQFFSYQHLESNINILHYRPSDVRSNYQFFNVNLAQLTYTNKHFNMVSLVCSITTIHSKTGISTALFLCLFTDIKDQLEP